MVDHNIFTILKFIQRTTTAIIYFSKSLQRTTNEFIYFCIG